MAGGTRCGLVGHVAEEHIQEYVGHMIVILDLIDENKIYMNDNKTSFSELVSQRKEWTARVHDVRMKRPARR